MRLFKVPGESLSQKVYSLSVDRTNEYVATGTNTGEIQIWRVQGFNNVTTSQEPVKASVESVKPFKSLIFHRIANAGSKTTGVDVNCVRFSKSSDELISGDSSGKVFLISHPWEENSKERLILDLYKKDFASNFIISQENNSLLQRKDNDEDDAIMDICWSADNRIVAVASLNNKVIIYDHGKDQVLSVLTEFNSAVKSISLDPNSNYLTVISNNKNIYVFQYKFKQISPTIEKFHIQRVQLISKLLQKSILTAKFNRFDWSPNGNLVLIPNGTIEIGKLASTNTNKSSSVINFNATNINHTYSLNNITAVAMLSPLNNFKNIYSMIGHKFSSLETIKFNPQLFKVTDKVVNSVKPEYEKDAATNELNEQIKNSTYYGIVATGGLDKTLVIWSTIIEKPLFIGKDFVNGAIIDIDWTSDGLSLFVGSTDGSISFLKFDPNELGLRASASELKEALAEVGRNIRPLDDPGEWKKLIEANAKENTVKTGAKENAVETGANVAERKQVEDEIKSSSKPTNEVSFTKPVNKEPQLNANRPTSNLKKATITKNGKKRVAPLLVSSYGHDSRNTGTRSLQTQTAQPIVTNEFDKPSNTVSKNIANLNIKRQRGTGTDEILSKRPKHYEPIDFFNTSIVNPSTAFAKLRLAVPKTALNINIKSASNPTLSLAIKNGSGNEQKPTRISVIVSTDSKTSPTSTLGPAPGNGPSLGNTENVKPNNAAPAHDLDGKLTDTKEIFVDFIPKIVNLVAGGDQNFWALSTLDGIVLTFSNSGRRIFPPLVLGSSLSFLECKNNFLMAVTSIGELYVWDIAKRKVHIKPVNLYSLFEPFNKYEEELLVKGDSLTLCSINSEGIPLVTLSSGNGYLYDKEMNSWCIISDSWWLFGSHYWDAGTTSSAYLGSQQGSDGFATSSLRPSHKNKSNIINLIESKTNEEIFKKRKTNLLKKISKIMLMKHGYENLEISISLAHLENKILVSEKLNDSAEFRKLLIGYCVRISELAYKNRLIEVFQDLLGPSYKSDGLEDDSESESDSDENGEGIIANSSHVQHENGNADYAEKRLPTTAKPNNTQSEGWSKTICGFDKHELLKEIILACARNREVQKILILYGKAVGLLADSILSL